MDSVSEADYKPPPEFIEDTKDSLVDLSMTDSKELWLIQWPVNQHPDFDGQELSLKLHQDGQLGKFEGSSGKLYNVVSFASQDPDATVFISSPSESKIVGKISRRVSLVHYPEPDELENQSANNLRKMYQRSGGSSLTHSSHHYSTPSHSTKLRNPQSVSGRSASTHSSRHKRRHADKPATSINQLTQDSGRGHSTVTSSGSLGLSHQGKSTKKQIIPCQQSTKKPDPRTRNLSLFPSFCPNPISGNSQFLNFSSSSHKPLVEFASYLFMSRHFGRQPFNQIFLIFQIRGFSKPYIFHSSLQSQLSLFNTPASLAPILKCPKKFSLA